MSDWGTCWAADRQNDIKRCDTHVMVQTRTHTLIVTNDHQKPHQSSDAATEDVQLGNLTLLCRANGEETRPRTPPRSLHSLRDRIQK